MTTTQLIRKDKRLLKAFKEYLHAGKKPNVKKFLPDDLYSTMRLEGEKITKKQAKALFR